MAEKTRLSRTDWTAAALEALAEGGVAAVAIERLAIRLGTTKGSAYWHFATRDALLRAALARWESDHTDAVIAVAEAGQGARAKLRALFDAVIVHGAGSAIERAVLGAAGDPLVAPVVRRVYQRRLGYLTRLYRGMGFGPAAARRRALAAYSVYLGLIQLNATMPEAVPRTRKARRAYVDDLLGALSAPPDDRVE